jgi:hypothetical protein
LYHTSLNVVYCLARTKTNELHPYHVHDAKKNRPATVVIALSRYLLWAGGPSEDGDEERAARFTVFAQEVVERARLPLRIYRSLTEKTSAAPLSAHEIFGKEDRNPPLLAVKLEIVDSPQSSTSGSQFDRPYEYREFFLFLVLQYVVTTFPINARSDNSMPRDRQRIEGRERPPPLFLRIPPKPCQSVPNHEHTDWFYGGADVRPPALRSYAIYTTSRKIDKERHNGRTAPDQTILHDNVSCNHADKTGPDATDRRELSARSY